MENTSSLEENINNLGHEKFLTFWKGMLYGLVILVAQILVIGIITILGTIIMGSDSLSMGSEYMTNLIIGIGLPASFLLAVFILLRRRKLHPNAWAWKNTYFLLLLIGILMLSGYGFVIGELLTYLPNYEAMLADYKEMFAGIDLKYLFIGGVIIGPICEEIIFRGIIEEGFITTYGGTKAIFYSALIFGVIHLLPLQVISTLLVGILLGWMYWKTHSLWIVIILHILNNFVAFTYSDLDAGSTRELFSNDLLYWICFPVIGALMYGGYVLFNRIADREVNVI